MKKTISPMATGGPFPVVSSASSASVSSCRLRSVSADGPISSLQFLGRHEDPSRTMACYGKNRSRLAELKRRYHPDRYISVHIRRRSSWFRPLILLWFLARSVYLLCTCSPRLYCMSSRTAVEIYDRYLHDVITIVPTMRHVDERLYVR